MPRFTRFGIIWRLLGPALVLVILVAVACGEAAAPTSPPPAAQATEAPQAAAQATEVPQAAPTTASAAPTAVPEAMAEPEAEVHPGKVIWLSGSFGAERFDYTFAGGTGHDYGRQIHAFLVSSDVKEGRRVFVPGIASKWEMSSDGLTWNLTIQQGVKFHDGTDLTAEDVWWTLMHAFGPQGKDYRNPNLMDPLLTENGIEQTGPYQVSVHTKVPATEFPPYISEASGDWYVVLPKRATFHDVKEEEAYDLNPIGAGIMRLVKHVPTDSMIFERFADYYHQPKNGFATDKRVNFTLLDLRLVPEEATRVAALRAGGADVAPVSLGARGQIEAGGGRLVLGKEGVYFNTQLRGCWKPEFPCTDIRVRQALNYAIDKELMRDTLYGPTVMELKGWGAVTPSGIGYSPELVPWPFDPDKARQLLADAGYPGGEGFGKLIVNTWVSTSMPLMPESAQLAAEMWKRELGLDVEVRVGDETALKKANSLTEDLWGTVYWRDNETRIDASRTLRGSYGTRNRNSRHHDDPELFALADEALSVVDPVERVKVLNSVYQRLQNEAYYVSLGYLNIPWGVGPGILTWEPYPLAFYPSALHTITLK